MPTPPEPVTKPVLSKQDIQDFRKGLRKRKSLNCFMRSLDAFQTLLVDFIETIFNCELHKEMPGLVVILKTIIRALRQTYEPCKLKFGPIPMSV